MATGKDGTGERAAADERAAAGTPARRKRRKAPAPRPDGPFRLALTGSRTFLGERLVAAMEEDPRCEHILVLDIARPLSAGPKTRFVRTDLTRPSVDGEMASILRDDGVDTLCHLAFLAFPSHATSWAHELEAIGTLYVMNAAAEARVRKVVMSSTTMVYGAHADNPNYLSERHPLRGIRRSRWVRDKVSAEKELARLKKDCPDIVTTSLRYAIMLGRSHHSFWARVLRRQVAVQLMGFDPLMQFVHEDDAADALLLSVRQDFEGAFNVAADGVLYWSQVMKLGGKLPVPVPHLLAGAGTTALWSLQLVDIPGPFLNYMRYAWCGDTRRMREVMGFAPRYSARETVLDFYRDLPGHGVEAERVGRLADGQPRTMA